MKIKTSDLIGASLDWAVMECYRSTFQMATEPKPWRGGIDTFGPGNGYKYPSWGAKKYNPSTNWELGGPIIDSLKPHFTIVPDNRGGGVIADTPAALLKGPTYLVAAMRCFVATNLGDEVEVPDCLI